MSDPGELCHNGVLRSPVATEIDYSVADRWCGVEVALVVELAGEEVGDVGPGDGPADPVGAEEAAPNVSSRGPVAGGEVADDGPGAVRTHDDLRQADDLVVGAGDEGAGQKGADPWLQGSPVAGVQHAGGGHADEALDLVALHRGHDELGSFDEGQAGGLPAHVRPQGADDRLPAADGIVDGGRVGDSSDDDVDAVGRPVRRHLVGVADVGDDVVPGLKEVVDEAADGAGGAEDGDLHEEAPAVAAVVARRTTRAMSPASRAMDSTIYLL